MVNVTRLHNVDILEKMRAMNIRIICHALQKLKGKNH